MTPLCVIPSVLTPLSEILNRASGRSGKQGFWELSKISTSFFRSLHQKILELESKLEDSKSSGTPRLAGSREELELKLSDANKKINQLSETIHKKEVEMQVCSFFWLALDYKKVFYRVELKLHIYRHFFRSMFYGVITVFTKVLAIWFSIFIKPVCVCANVFKSGKN